MTLITIDRRDSKPNCSAQSKECGDRCIPRSYNCHIDKRKLRNSSGLVGNQGSGRKVSAAALTVGGIALVGAGGALGVWATRAGSREKVSEARAASEREIDRKVASIEARMASQERAEKIQSNISLNIQMGVEGEALVKGVEADSAARDQAVARAKQEEAGRYESEIQSVRDRYDRELRAKETSLRQEYEQKVKEVAARAQAEASTPQPEKQSLTPEQEMAKAEAEFSGSLQIIGRQRDEELSVVQKKFEPELSQARAEVERATNALASAASDPANNLQGLSRDLGYAESQLSEKVQAYEAATSEIEGRYSGRLQEMAQEAMPNTSLAMPSSSSPSPPAATSKIVSAFQSKHQEEIKTLRSEQEAELKKITEESDRQRAEEVDSLTKEYEQKIAGMKAEAADIKVEKEKIRKQMKAKYDQEIQAAEAQISQKYKSETALQVKRAKLEASQAATEKLANERLAAAEAAKEEIRVASLPKPRRSGELAYDSDGAVSLEGSQRNGLRLSDTATLGRRVDRASASIVGKHSVEILDTFNADFKEEAERITNANYIESDDQRWRQMSDAMMVQADREAALQLGINEVTKRTRERYRVALEAMDGNFSDESLQAFDQRSKAIAAMAKREATKLLNGIRKVEPFTIDYRAPRS